MTLTHKKFIEQNLDIRSKSGDEWQALCPFHKDSNPSFSVNVKKGLYICYACGEKGNIKKLADFFNFGSDLQKEQATIEDVSKGIQELKEELNRTERPNVGIKIPQRFLDSPSNSHYWWKTRGIATSTRNRYQLGFDDLANDAIIPLKDLSGRTLGLIRRHLDLNSPMRYQYPRGLKISENLFGADVALKDYENLTQYLQANSITHAGVIASEFPLVITEGSVDAMAVHQAGCIAVAVLGARISKEQVNIIRRIGPTRIIVATDRDRAGREASLQIANALRQSKMGVQVAEISWSGAVSTAKDMAELSLTEMMILLKQKFLFSNIIVHQSREFGLPSVYSADVQLLMNLK